jgi:small-conductance mechanosensitive channel
LYPAVGEWMKAYVKGDEGSNMRKVNRVLRGNSMLPRVVALVFLAVLSSLFAFLPVEHRTWAGEQTETSNPAHGESNQGKNEDGKATTSQPSQDVRLLFERAPLGWDTSTITLILGWVVALPEKAPEFVRYIAGNRVVLIQVGSIMLAVLMVSLLYRFAGRRRVFERIEKAASPLLDLLPKALRLVVDLLVNTVAASLVPLLLWGSVFVIRQFIAFKVPWLNLTLQLLGLWAASSLGIHLLRGLLTGGALSSCPIHGHKIFQFLRLSLVYALLVLGLALVAAAVHFPSEVLAFLQFAAGLSIVLVFFLLFLKKLSFLSLLPDLPYRSYNVFARFLERFYFPLIVVSAAVGVLMCLGYKRFALAFFTKTWLVGLSYVAVMAGYHFLSSTIHKWSERKTTDEAARYFFRSAKSLLRYATFVTGSLILLVLLGLLEPLQQVMSFTILTIGGTSISFWLVVRAVIIMLAFTYVSQLLQTYLDYKLYPSLGIETGLAYALNTFLKYSFIVAGLLFALTVVGIDLRVLMVFAGTAGIGVGFGLKGIVANMISGLILIFGRELRKGDWVQVGDTVGVVSGIFLRATKLMTRDNIDYLIPNTDFIDKMIVNYSLTSPFVRVHVPVGVSDASDPEKVKQTLLECAEREDGVARYDKPKVWFTSFGDSSINFELLAWMDIRRFSQKEIKSRLNFQIARALREAGIQMPNPQRDIYIRSAEGLAATSTDSDEKKRDAATSSDLSKSEIH